MMSAMAEMLLGRGYCVSGSDIKASEITKHLTERGINVSIGHDASHIPPETGLVIKNAAVRPDNPEIIEARRRGLPILDRAEALGEMMGGFDVPVCVAGTHGKTTATAMIGHIMESAGLDPTVLNGGLMLNFGAYWKESATLSPYFIVESCEYKLSFLAFRPRVGVILNVEMDHSDFFRDVKHVRDGFTAFADLIPEDGTLVVLGNQTGLDLDALKCKVVTFWDGEVTAKDIHFDENGHPAFDIYRGNERLGNINLAVHGAHNVKNAVAAAACCLELGVGFDEITKALGTFKGTGRRFEYRGKVNGVPVYNDYAHHPSEVKTTLETAALMGKHPLRAVFQPHTRSRTMQFLDAFAESFDAADEVIITDIFMPAGREENDILVSGADLAERIRAHGKNARFIPKLEDTAIELSNIEGGTVVLMGAGDINRILLTLECE